MDHSSSSSGSASVQTDTILLVDDNTTNLQLLHETLERPEYKLLVAKNGRSALSIAQRARPSLILLDIMMPEMDGYEVCRRLKADDTTHQIPVIFITALADEEDEAKGLELGAADYISKPINARKLTSPSVFFNFQTTKTLKKTQTATKIIVRYRCRIIPPNKGSTCKKI